MPRLKLSKSKIDALKHPDKGQVIYWDTDTPGLGLVVGAKTKTFRVQIDVKDSNAPSGYRTVKKTLGRYGHEITLEQAKALLGGYVDSDGNAVIGERLKLKLKPVDEPQAVPGVEITLNELIAKYYQNTKRRDGKERKPGTAGQYTKLVTRHYEGWMGLTLPELSEITPDSVLDKYKHNETAHGPATARNSSSVLSSILNYGKATYPAALPNNPLAVLSNPYIAVRQEKKERHECLKYEIEHDHKRNDFVVFLQGVQSCTELIRDGLLFTLYTGMRRAEVENLTWANINIPRKKLLIQDTKNRLDLHIPLNSQAMAIIERRKAAGLHDTFVFPAARSGGKNRTGHIQLNPQSLKKHTGLDITVHGLRRSFITTGRQLKRFEDADRLTNHVDGSMSGKHYDETDLSDLRETSQMIGNEIERRMLDKKAKVIELATAKAA